MEKEKANLLKKWWFWICIVLIICIISASAIFAFIHLNKNDNNLTDIQEQINNISNRYTLYISNDKILLFSENANNNSDTQAELEKVIKVLKENINTTFKNCTTLICIDFLESNSKNNELVVRQIYSLPNFEQLESISYIKFDTYKALYNTYEDTMNKYTNLFMSIGR